MLNFIFDQVFKRFASQDQMILAAAQAYHGGTRNAVIIGGHRIVVRARRQHRNKIVAGHVLGQGNVLLQNVAALTATSYYRAGEIGGGCQETVSTC